MSWCDKLASVPMVGVRMSSRLIPGDFMLKAIAPAVLATVDNDAARFVVEEHSSFGVKFGTQDGFKYGLDPKKAHVAFQHQLRAVPTVGGPPVMQMLSRPLPYTELLPEVCRRLEAVVTSLPESRERLIERIGVVSTTYVDEENLPPGLRRFIDYIRRPWDESPENFNINLSVEVGKDDRWVDKCQYTLIKPEDREALMTINLDWGREYSSERRFDDVSFRKDLEHCSQDALNFFENVAEGQNFDV